jgi:hypothetical protein
VRATKEIKARGTRVAVKGHLVREVTQSLTEKVGDQEQTTTWIEVLATEIANVPLMEIAVPATLAPGDEIDLKILAPAPKLGPPSVHLSVYMVVWTLQVEWDIAAGADERVAAVINVAQNPDLLRSGVMSLGPSAMMAAWSEGEVSMDVEPAPPIAPGSALQVNVRWPSASGGRGARVELYADLKMALPVRITAAELQTSDLAKGSLITFEIPSDAPPVFDSAQLSLRYRIALVIFLLEACMLAGVLGELTDRADALIARARVAKSGRTLTVLTVEVAAVTDGAEKECALVQQTVFNQPAG